MFAMGPSSITALSSLQFSLFLSLVNSHRLGKVEAANVEKDKEKDEEKEEEEEEEEEGKEEEEVNEEALVKIVINV